MHIAHWLKNSRGFLLATLLLSVIGNAAACKGLQEEAMQNLIAAARELSDFVDDDNNFLSLWEMSYEDQRKTNFEQGMQPIDFSQPQHRIDKFALGDVFVELHGKNGTEYARGSGYKISRRCVVTAAHVLYPYPAQKISADNKGKYSGKIRFVVGEGKEKKESEATVFFQMTKKGDFPAEDYPKGDYWIDTLFDQIKFSGHSDVIILKLSDMSDDFYKSVKVVTPDQLFKGIDPSIGRKIVCMGSPSHMTSRNFGNCKGSEFKWKQVNARIFQEDDRKRRPGVVTNAAISPGISGGACFLAEDTSQLIGIPVNALNARNANVMPHIVFRGSGAAWIATFHRLDARMKSELGYGLDELDKYCK